MSLLLFDVDGTIISYDGVVPQSTVDGIRLARENGHKVCVVTGRTLFRAVEGDIEVDGHICGNGAYIDFDGKVIKDLSMSAEETGKIIDYLDERDFQYFFEGNDGIYGSPEFETKSLPAFVKYGLKNPVIKELYPDMTFPENRHIGGITKVNYVLKEYQDYLDFKEAFPEFKCLTWGGKGEEAIFGDCAAFGIDKQNAVEELIAYSHFPKEDIYAFGDAEVDIPLFRSANTSICVGGGREEAKKAATYVTDDVKEDGIYNALKHFNLI